MWLDVLGAAILGGFVLMGAFRGTLASVLQISSLVVAYAVAIWAAPRYGELTAERLAIPEIFGVAVAGAVAFFLSYFAFGVITAALRGIERRRRRGLPRSTPDRLGGALIGGAQGCLITLLLGWLGLWIQAGHSVDALEFVPDTSASAISELSQTVVETGANALLSSDADPTARIAVRLAARPADTLDGVQSLLSNPHVEGLQHDRLFWSYVEHGAVDSALNRASFLGIAYDETLRREFADIGLVSQAAASDPTLFRDAVQEVIAQLGPRIQAIKSDPALRDLVDDPEIRAALESGDTFAVVKHPAFRRLFARVIESGGAAE